jgi:hypothetical protein
LLQLEMGRQTVKEEEVKATVPAGGTYSTTASKFNYNST